MQDVQPGQAYIDEWLRHSADSPGLTTRRSSSSQQPNDPSSSENERSTLTSASHQHSSAAWIQWAEAQAEANAGKFKSPLQQDNQCLQHGRAGQQYSKVPRQSTPSGPMRRVSHGQRGNWWTWPEVKIKITRLPRNVDLPMIFQLLKTQNCWVHSIDIDLRGVPSAYVILRNPLPRPLWQVRDLTLGGYSTPVRIELIDNNREFWHPSPIDMQKKYRELMVLKADRIDFGFWHEPNKLMVMQTVSGSPHSKPQFKLDLKHKRIEVHFGYTINFGQSGQSRFDHFMIRVPLHQITGLSIAGSNNGRKDVYLTLASPPLFYRRSPNVAQDLKNAKQRGSATLKWTEWEAWIRQTDVAHDDTRRAMYNSPTQLLKHDSILDLGRWLVYKLAFSMAYDSGNGHIQDASPVFNDLMSALSDYNVNITSSMELQTIPRIEPQLWGLIEDARKSADKDVSNLEALSIDIPPLDFELRYQLEACISQGMLTEYSLDRAFLVKLSSYPSKRACRILERVCESNKRIFNPMDIFKTHSKGLLTKKTLSHCVIMHSVTITPSTIYINTPTQEISNRVVRQYSEFADRFLRVRFTDEKLEGKLQSCDPREDAKIQELLSRIRRTFRNGIEIAGRRYMFLAFGNSQFREHGAYFFCPTPEYGPDEMRVYLGEFHDIKVVAKYCARIGQCFSTTRAINCGKIKITPISDVEWNGYRFTDGIGKISRYLLLQVADQWGVPLDPAGDPPSLVQFRLGGCKGVLALAPGLATREIQIRESQYKFPAKHEGLEIIRVSAFATVQLNRQIIIVLSNLGVKDEVFEQKLKEELSEMNLAMEDESVALRNLQKRIDFNQMTLTVAEMILHGFFKHRDPFTMSILQLWRAWRIKYLKEKASITIEKSAFLLGCTDETKELRGHIGRLQSAPDLSREAKLANLPEIFLQVSNDPVNKAKYTTVEGLCILARNPSLHPGDIRVVRAVDKPSLRHLKNVVVLPQTGDRDLANMCSGGDLDGDDFMIIWDPDLLSSEINHPPMDYTAPTPPETANITVNQLADFFVNYIKNDSLGRIATAHLAQADYQANGVQSEQCLELAQLHSCAVDYPKSGVPAQMRRELRPKLRPHFMYKGFGKKTDYYHSQKVIGKLFDAVELAKFRPSYGIAFDQRILKAFELDEATLGQAAELKAQYDSAVCRIQAQFAIATGFEVWSTFVLSHNAHSDYKFHEEIGQHASILKSQFKKLCIEAAGDSNVKAGLGRFVAAMYTVTARQVEEAVRKELERKEDEEEVEMPDMSFPWIFVKELGQIANKSTITLGQSIGVTQGAVRQHQHQVSLRQEETGAKDLLISFTDDIETAQGITHRGDLLELAAAFEKVSLKDSSPKKAQRTSNDKAKASVENAKPSAVVEDPAIDYESTPDPPSVVKVNQIAPLSAQETSGPDTHERVDAESPQHAAPSSGASSISALYEDPSELMNWHDAPEANHTAAAAEARQAQIAADEALAREIAGQDEVPYAQIAADEALAREIAAQDDSTQDKVPQDEETQQPTAREFGAMDTALPEKKSAFAGLKTVAFDDSSDEEG